MKEELLSQYAKNRSLYKAYSNYLKDRIEGLLQDNNITYQSVNSRTKDIDSLSKKLNKENKIEKLNGSIKNMYDLSGIRIILYDKRDINRIVDILRNDFNIDIIKEPKHKYDSINLKMSLKEHDIFDSMRFEVQIVTVLTHVVLESCHDIIYKDKYELESKDKNKYHKIELLYSDCYDKISSIEKEINMIKEIADSISD